MIAVCERLTRDHGFEETRLDPNDNARWRNACGCHTARYGI